jgi:hypothetical protein
LLNDWIEELLCDHLAIEVMGPAFVWAFAAFVMPLTYGEPGEAHPPNPMRLRLALDHLDRRGWRPYMDRVAPGTAAWLEGVAADANAQLDPPFAFLRDQLLPRGHLLQDVAQTHLGAGSLDTDPTEKEADEAADLLGRLILPVGLRDPLQARSILLGGWQSGINDHGDTPAGLVEALGDFQTQELVGKAIEMSTVARCWT